MVYTSIPTNKQGQGRGTKTVRKTDFGKGDAEVRLLTLKTEFGSVDNRSPKFISQFHELMEEPVPAARVVHIKGPWWRGRDGEDDYQRFDDRCDRRCLPEYGAVPARLVVVGAFTSTT
jgi:hypothetical protein